MITKYGLFSLIHCKHLEKMCKNISTYKISPSKVSGPLRPCVSLMLTMNQTILFLIQESHSRILNTLSTADNGYKNVSVLQLWS